MNNNPVHENQHPQNETVSIIIVNYNTVDLLRKCVDSILQHDNAVAIEIIVVDNASADGSSEMIRNSYKEVILIENPTNVGFAVANNIGIRAAKGNYLLLLNSDTIILPGALEILARFLDEHPDASLVGPKLLNPDMSLQRSWFNFPSPFKTFCHIIEISKPMYKLNRFESVIPFFLKQKLPAFMLRDIHVPMKVDYLLLACLMARRDVFDKIGPLDENLFFYHEDCDLGYRARANALNMFYCPTAQIVHLGGSSSAKIKLSSYRAYFKSLIYVVSKHENRLAASGMRLFVVVGMAIRIALCLLGLYRDINKIGIYKKQESRGKRDRPAFSDLMSNYFRIALESLRPGH